MKYLEAAMLLLIVALAISLEYTYTTLSGENQQLTSAFNDLNQSYNQLYNNLTGISNQVNDLRSLLLTGATAPDATLWLELLHGSEHHSPASGAGHLRYA